MSKLISNTNRGNKKILIIVGIQIALLLTSYLILEKFESDKKFLGQTISYAGKNRFLTEQVLLETMNSMNGYAFTVSPMVGLASLEKNIEIVKTGGVINDDTLSTLPSDMIPYWQPLHDHFIAYKNSVEEFYKHKPAASIINDKFTNIQTQANDLIGESNVFVTNLADFSDNSSKFILNLQIFLMLLNVVIHALLIVFIIRIVRSEAKEMKKIERLGIIGETASRLAHDLRNPLSIIKMNLDIMKLKSVNDLQDQTTQKWYDVISRAIWRMSHQIDDVLDFVNPKPLELGKYSLLETISGVVEGIPKPENVKINLPSNDVKIVCDEKRLEIVFINLITNAIQAVGDKGEVTIRIIDKPDDIRILIEDSGLGIPKNDMTRIFDPLFTTKQIGTGLGLSSCKNIVEQHNGTISVANYPTTFTVTIPKIKDELVDAYQKKRESLLHV